MKIAILELNSKEKSLAESLLLPRLARTGGEVTATLMVSDVESLASGLQFLFGRAQCLLVCGDTTAVKAALSVPLGMPAANIADMFVLGEHDVILIPAGSNAEFVDSIVIPAVTAKVRTLFVCETLRTYGLSEAQVKELLRPFMKNRAKIGVSVSGEFFDCEVAIRYSNKTGKITVDETIRAITDKLKDYIYSTDGMCLYERVFELLKQRNKKIAVAESFTGGAICAKIVSREGASGVLDEGFVVYSDGSKVRRLDVPSEIIMDSGAVSGEAAYEMAAGILHNTGADIALATTGYAGPEPSDKAGHCFIAVGTMDGIHVYEHNFAGSRADVIGCGVQAAFYHLMRILSGEQQFF